MAWLSERGASRLVAHVHPDHAASAQVAARAGLVVTDEMADGEQVWRMAAPRAPEPGDTVA